MANSPFCCTGTSLKSGTSHGMYSTVSPFGTAPIRCTCTSGIKWLTPGRLKASAMPATLSHCVMPPTRTRSIIGISTERASSMWRNGTMPQTYSPPATGVDSASLIRARPAKSSAVVTSSSQNRPTPASSTRLPMSIACSGRQRWLMSHINLMSGPIASRILTMRSTSIAGVVSPGSAVLQLLLHRFDPHRILADAERAQFVDRMPQRAAQRASEIRDAETLDSLIGLDRDGDDRALAVRVLGGAGERLVGRQFDKLGAGSGNLHG